MNIETDLTDFQTTASGASLRQEVMRKSMAALAPMVTQQDALWAILEKLIKVGARATIERARKLQARLADVEPASTMIGQG